MQKHLFFICPTDHLETVINKSFGHENYFYASLGNSVSFDIAAVGQIKQLIIENQINKISFVLSDDNHFISGASEKQSISEVAVLNSLYKQITKQKRYSKLIWQSQTEKPLLISYHLRNKANELKVALSSLSIHGININCKIYNHQENSFHDIYSNLICMDSFNLN